MASGSHAVWALDIGNNSLKALRLRSAGEKLEVVALDYIEHSKILSSAGITAAEKSEIIQNTLHTFVQRNELGKDEIAVSVPGQTSFARFIKLPPVEPKRIPEIVKFEAVQQIPFDINEVEWDWQLMPNPDSPDTEVGIFAIKNELISSYLENFTAKNMRVSTVQMSPMALYNYAFFDRPEAEISGNKAVVVMDMGAENTNLVICTKTSVWQRCILLGGNSFTKAIEGAFKLKFEKAERLKRSAPMSKYARQIFHAMKPVFTDFGAEVQRSLGYYSNSNKGVIFSKIILLGGGFKLQGLSKYTHQATQLPVVRPDEFEKLIASAEVSTAKLHDNICDFGSVYGLGLQGLGLAKIESNLLPGKVARSMMWARKGKYFYIAAAVLLAVILLAFLKTNLDKKAYYSKESQDNRRQVEQVIAKARNAASDLKTQEMRDSGYEEELAKQIKLYDNRNIIPMLHEVLIKCLPNEQNTKSASELYKAFKAGDIETIKTTPRKQRKQVFVTGLSVRYFDSLVSAPLVAKEFATTARSSSRRSGAGVSSMTDMGGGMDEGFGGGMFSLPGAGRTPAPSRRASAPVEEAEVTDGRGFVVVIEGYTPYEDIDELMDPAGVGDDKNRWGIVTRLMNLDANSPFELFQRKNIAHFRREGDIVDMSDAQMPAGIGLEEVKIRAEEAPAANIGGRRGAAAGRSESDAVTTEVVLVDMMTNEEISRTFELDSNGRKKYDAFGKPVFIDRDRWFRLKFKLLWKEPVEESESNLTNRNKVS
ncbi:MAG: pilus assembly protein PilM [Anaerohalosphaeraceae bacterium]|nr:pilus assembly protein PilM [Anaerohalosphaeraceae bacterium]